MLRDDKQKTTTPASCLIKDVYRRNGEGRF